LRRLEINLLTYLLTQTNIARVLTVVLVEDSVDDRVTAAGQEDKDLCHGVTVDKDTSSSR